MPITITKINETTFKVTVEFFLERDSNTSILGAFDLPKIQRYFPEYENTIRTMLK